MDTTNAAANGNITLEGFIDTRGIDNAAAGKGGLIQLTTVNGNITTQAGATLNAEGGDAGADGVPDDEGGVIRLTAVDAGNVENVGDIQTGDFVRTSTELAKPVRVILNAEEDVTINKAIVTRGGSVDIDAGRNITSTLDGDIRTTGDTANEDSGDVTMDTTNAAVIGRITLAGFIDTRGIDNAAAGKGGLIQLTTVNGNITTQAGATLNAEGGDAGADGVPDDEGGLIQLTAADAGNVENVGDIQTGDFVRTSTELAKPVRVILNAEEDVTINKAIVTRGGSVDIDAGRNITSTLDGDIRTTGDTANEDSGDVTMDTTNAAVIGRITLAGFIDTRGIDNAAAGKGGLIQLTTVNGNITTQAGATLNAEGGDAGADGVPDDEGGLIQLTAADAGNVENVGDIQTGDFVRTSTELAKPVRVILNAEEDVTINAAIVTRGGSVDIDAGRNITSAAAGDIRTTGDKADEDSGNVTMDTTNAALNGDIRLAGFIDTRGIENAAAGKGGLIQLTTVNGNITTQTGATLNAEGGDANADGVPDDNGGVIALDAVTGSVFDSAASIQNNQIELAAHGLQTGDLVIYTNGGGTDIGGLTNGKTYAVIVVDANNIRLAATQEAAINNGTAISITSDAVGTAHRLVTTRGDVTLGDIIRTSNNGVVRLEASGRIVDGTGPLGTKAVNIIAPALLMRAQTGIGDGGSGNAADIRIDGAGLPGASGIRIAAVTNSGDINITSLANLTTVTDVVGGGTIQSFDAGDASDGNDAAGFSDDLDLLNTSRLRIRDNSRNATFDGNITLIAAIGTIDIGEIGAAWGVRNAAGGDVILHAATDVVVRNNVGIVARDTNPVGNLTVEHVTNESIRISTTTGNIVLGNAVTITTDECSDDSFNGSKDEVLLRAGTNGDQLFNYGTDLTIATDGGIAKDFLARDPIFFTPATPINSPIIATVTLDPLKEIYLVEFTFSGIGTLNEENLRIDVDWRDPGNGTRVETFYLNNDSADLSISHEYESSDFVDFVIANKPKFLVDFSVSKHHSIQVLGGSVQEGNGVSVPIANTPQNRPGLISSTDDNTTGSFQLFDPKQLPATDPETTELADLISDTESKDVDLESGLVEVAIPTIVLPQIAKDPTPPAPNPAPVPVPNPAAPVLLTVQATAPEETPSPTPQSPSEDYFQLRDQFGNVVRGFDRIPDEEGELLLQPTELRIWVQKNLQEQTGLQLWLITEKVVGSGSVTIARPVLKFDVSNGIPFPADEALPENFEFPQLQLDVSDEEMSEDNDASNKTSPDAGASAAPTDEMPDAEKPAEKENADNDPAVGNPGDVPKPSDKAEKPASEEQPQASSTLQRSAMASVAVAAVLNRPQAVSNGFSQSRKLLNKLLSQR